MTPSPSSDLNSDSATLPAAPLPPRMPAKKPHWFAYITLGLTLLAIGLICLAPLASKWMGESPLAGKVGSFDGY